MEKKNSLWIFALAIILAMVIGAALAISGPGQPYPLKGSGIEDTRIDDIEREIERGNKAVGGGIEESGNAAGNIEQRERLY